MAYDKYTWHTGEVITQEKLNHMEDGIENAYELPAVTETDNGKVLGVENGQFGLVEGGGSGGGMIHLIQNTGLGTDYQYLQIGAKELYDGMGNGEIYFVRPVFPGGGSLSLDIVVSARINGSAYNFEVLRLSQNSTVLSRDVFTQNTSNPNDNPVFEDID